MNPKYATFIAAELARYRKQWRDPDTTDASAARGMCGVMTKALAAAFPELKCVLGFIDGHEHAWNVTPDGEIVDGTAIQFGPPPYDYEEYDAEKHTVKIGCCANCGEDIYGKMTDSRKEICSDACERAYIAYLNSGR